MKYSIYIILCLLSTFSSVSFAASEIGDCELFKQWINKIDMQGTEKYTNIYPHKNIETAVNNLRSYCCKVQHEESLCKSSNNTREDESETYAYSNKLYDHLIDVGFRALDGDPSLYHQQPLLQLGDKNGEQRYTTITELATNVNGAIPLKIRKEYGTYWWFKENGEFVYNLNEEKDCKNNSEQYKDFNERWNTSPTDEKAIPLAAKYLITCHITQCIQAPWYQSEPWDFSLCKALAIKRIKSESSYVQIQMVQQWLAGLLTNFEAYTEWYFIQDRFQKLLEKINEMNAGLTHVNNKVSEMTKMCSS